VVARRLIAIIVGVAIAVALVGVGLFELVSSQAPTTACPSGLTTDQSIATGLAFSGSTDTIKGAEHWYNFTVESSSPCDGLGVFVFQVKTPQGAVTNVAAGAGLSVVKPPSSVEATFTLGAGWTYFLGSSSHSPIETEDILSLFYNSSTPTSLVGDTLVALGTGSAAGAVSAPIT
jgi:hypothetical protein